MILLIEDDATTCDVTATLFRLDGHDVRTASDGREALAILERERPTVIFSDLRMPHVDGWQFRKIQLQSPMFRDIPFVIVSAAITSAEDERVLAPAMTFSKPVDMDDLLRCAKKYDSLRPAAARIDRDAS